MDEPSDKQSFSVEEVQKKHSNAYESWSRTDDLRLINDHMSHKSITELAMKYKRSQGAIRARLKKLDLIN